MDFVYTLISQCAHWFMHIPPCGARKTHRAYANPRVFRPLRKLRPCFFCHWQRKAAIPPGLADMIRIPLKKKDSPPRGTVFFSGAPAGIRTPDTLLKRQVLCLLSYWGVSSEQAADRLASVKHHESSLPPLLLLSKSNPLSLGFDFVLKRNVASFPNRSPAERVRFGEGRRNLRMCSFRRPGGSGVDQVSSDVVAGMAGLEPTISESKSGALPLHYIPVSGQKRPAWPASE